MDKKNPEAEVMESEKEYCSGWLRPAHLQRNRISDENIENKTGIGFPQLQLLQRSYSSVSNATKRIHPSTERTSEFESPTKKIRTTIPMSPGNCNNRCLSKSPDPMSLVHRMTTRDDSPKANTEDNFLASYLPSYRVEITPTRLRFGQRQSLLPAPTPISPSEFLEVTKKPRFGGRKLIIAPSLAELVEKKPNWHKKLCLDWSLKTSLRIHSAVPFGWTSTHLRASEESSGTSAFARCIDISSKTMWVGTDGNGSSQLDTSLGAQFHSACLYWQHPYIPSVNLFPRLGKTEQASFSATVQSLPSSRLDENMLNYIQVEWIDAFRSSFQLLRSRQCPYFYLCAPQFTALFTAAGTQGDERTQIYINPSTKGLREALKEEGVNFTMPYWTNNTSETDLLGDGARPLGDITDTHRNEKEAINAKTKAESDDETDKWLDDMGISQDVTLTNNRSTDFAEGNENAKKSLIMIVGASDSLSFFNFLLNARQFLVTTSASNLHGIPPTILNPIAFHGATLRTLKVKQSGKGVDTGKLKHNIELVGPILPHVIHNLCSLLSSTVENYVIQLSTLKHTIPLNLYSNVKLPPEKVRPTAFELQNLSDCGLCQRILQIFCKCDNCDTVSTKLECKDSLFQWI